MPVMKILNNNDYASDFRTKINDNFAALNNDHTPKNHAVSATTYGVGTTGVYGHVKVKVGNGLNISSGEISMGTASTSGYGAVRLASSATSTSTTDVITGKLLSDALRGQSKLPKIFYGTSDPTSSTPSGSQNGDIYVKYE